MKRTQLVLLILLCWTTSHIAYGATTSLGGVKPSLKRGELIRLEAKVGEIKGGFAYIFAKEVKHTRNGLKLHATLKAKTNTFFDKIHKVNNRFNSRFQICGAHKPFYYHLDVDQAGTLMTRTVHFTPSGRKSSLSLNAYYKTYKGKPYNRRYRNKQTVPPNTHNLVSAIYHARFLPYKPGKVFTFYLFSTGRLWHLTGQLTRKTKIHSILGKRRALLITAYARRAKRGATKRKILLWVTDDNQRIPLKILGYVPFIGTATATLHGYRKSLRSTYIDGSRGRGSKRSSSWGFLSSF